MPAYLQFMRKAIIFIDWEQHIEKIDKEDSGSEEKDEIILKNKQYIEDLIHKSNLPFQMLDEEIIPISQENYMENYTDGLKKIVKFLNENLIIWTGGIVNFVRNEKPGILAIKGNNIVVGYLDDNLDMEKEYIPY